MTYNYVIYVQHITNHRMQITQERSKYDLMTKSVKFMQQTTSVLSEGDSSVARVSVSYNYDLQNMPFNCSDSQIDKTSDTKYQSSWTWLPLTTYAYLIPTAANYFINSPKVKEWTDKELSYCRQTVQCTMSVNFAVAQAMGVKAFTAKVTFKVIQRHWQRCRLIGHIQFPNSLPSKLCLYHTLLTRYYHLFPQI